MQLRSTTEDASPLEHAQQPLATSAGSLWSAGEGFGLQAAPSAEGFSRRQIAAHESPRTTKVYDRTTDQVSLDEIV
jgi:hypothetical protein